MAYFIFLSDCENIEGTIYRIAENQSDLNSLNIVQNNYKIIEDSQENFNFVKLNIKQPVSYSGNIITYVDESYSWNLSYEDIQQNLGYSSNLKIYVNNCINSISCFLNVDSNKNNLNYNKWNNYKNQLSSLDLKSITYPLNKSLEQYFNDLGQPSLNILQLP